MGYLDKETFFFRDGLSIFGSKGMFIQRVKPGIPAAGVEVVDLDSSESEEIVLLEGVSIKHLENKEEKYDFL